MSNPWTPGPWEVRNKRSVHPSSRPFVAAAVAEQHDANSEANARLIAAAPEMAEALKAWIEPWNGFDELNTRRRCDPATWERIKETCTLLARIRGE